MACGCPKSEEQKDRQRFKTIAAGLPLIKGTIIKTDGTRVNISDLFEIPTTEADPQLARSQNIFPYIRDTILLEDGKTCLLSDLLQKILDELSGAGVVYTKETRFDYVEVGDEDWGIPKNILFPIKAESYELQEEDW